MFFLHYKSIVEYIKNGDVKGKKSSNYDWRINSKLSTESEDIFANWNINNSLKSNKTEFPYTYKNDFVDIQKVNIIY